MSLQGQNIGKNCCDNGNIGWLLLGRQPFRLSKAFVSLVLTTFDEISKALAPF
jgi:hypothetical protein